MLSTIIGGAVGAEHSQAAADHQKNAIMQVLAKLDEAGIPPDQSAIMILQQFQQQGTLTPQLEAMLADSVSQFTKLGGSSSVLRAQQANLLNKMIQRAGGGFTPEDRAQFNQSRQSVQRDLEAKNQQIAQEFQARGMGGAGQEMAQRLLSSQAGADRASEEGDRLSTTAFQAKLAALRDAANMAGQLRSQDFSEAATVAGEEDQMKRFDIQNQIGREQRNTQAANQAQAANLSVKQGTADQNVGINNNEKYAAKQREVEHWQNMMQRASQYAAPLMAYGNVNAQTEMGKANRAVGIGTGIDKAIKDIFKMAYGMPPSDDKDEKEEKPSSGGSSGPTNTGSIYSGGNGGYSVGSVNGMYK